MQPHFARQCKRLLRAISLTSYHILIWKNKTTKAEYTFHYYADGIEVTQRIYNAIATANILRPKATVPCLICHEKRSALTGNPHIEKAISEAFDSYDKAHAADPPTAD